MRRDASHLRPAVSTSIDLARARLVEKKAAPLFCFRRSDVSVVVPTMICRASARPSVIPYRDRCGPHGDVRLPRPDGLPAARVLIDRAGLASDARFLGCLQGLVKRHPADAHEETVGA